MPQQINKADVNWGLEFFFHKLASLYQQYVHVLILDPIFWVLLGVCFLLGLMFSLFLKRKSKIIKLSGEGCDQALVSRRALHDLVNLACSRIGTPGKPKIVFKMRCKKLDLILKLKLYENQSLKKIRQNLHDTLMRVLQQTHGISIGKVNIVAIGFKKNGLKSDHLSIDSLQDYDDSISGNSADLSDVSGADKSNLQGQTEPEVAVEKSEDLSQRKSSFNWKNPLKRKEKKKISDENKSPNQF